MPDRWLRTRRKRIAFTEYMDRGYRSVVESLPNNSELHHPHPHPHPHASHYILSSQDKKRIWISHPVV